MDIVKSEVDCLKPKTFWTNEHFAKLHENLHRMFDSQQFCDITLISSDKKYKIMAHKNVLASVSKYFLAMFGGSLCESEADKVTLGQIDGCTLKLILNFIYKGRIELSIETVEPVLVASNFLEISSLEKVCCSYMMENIDVSNCLEISCWAKRHNFAELQAFALLYACEHFVTLKDEDQFCTQDVELLCELISNDNLRMQSEADVFQSVMVWINYKKDDRTQHLEKLLSHVRFPLLTPGYIGGIFAKEESESTEMTRIICKALVWHAVPDMRTKLFTDEQSKIRNFKDVIITINGCNSSADLSVAIYYSGLKEWLYTRWPAIPHRRSNLKWTVVGKTLILVGAEEPNSFSNRVDTLNLDTLKWEVYPRLNVARPKVVAASKGTIFALSSTSCDKLQQSSENWTTFPIASCPVGSMGIFDVFEDRVYYLCNNCYCIYNIAEGTTNSKTIPRLTSATSVGLHIIRHLLTEFLVEVTSSTVYVFDLETSACVIQNTLSSPLGQSAKTALHGKKIIINKGNTFFEYNPFDGTSVELPPMCNNHESVEIMLTNNSHGM